MFSFFSYLKDLLYAQGIKSDEAPPVGTDFETVFDGDTTYVYVQNKWYKITVMGQL